MENEALKAGGTSPNVAQEMGGWWASYEMVLRYAQLSAAHLLPHAERIVVAGRAVGRAVESTTAVLLQQPHPNVVAFRRRVNKPF